MLVQFNLVLETNFLKPVNIFPLNFRKLDLEDFLEGEHGDQQLMEKQFTPTLLTVMPRILRSNHPTTIQMVEDGWP